LRQACIAAVPVSHFVFDVLYLRDQLLTGLPYTRRRDLLEGFAAAHRAGGDAAMMAGGGSRRAGSQP
jgi:ATP-dependent DNA ligase